jgi:hypothetical protein
MDARAMLFPTTFMALTIDYLAVFAEDEMSTFQKDVLLAERVKLSR